VKIISTKTTTITSVASASTKPGQVLISAVRRRAVIPGIVGLD
jgi:hypothetical protein